MADLSKLLAGARTGGDDEVTALVQATYRDVWTLCAHLVDPASADDLAQETYLRAFRGLTRFRGKGPVRVWLLTIARRTCMDELRRRVRRRDREVLHADPAVATPPTPLPSTGALATGHTPADGEHLEVRRLLALLPAERRTAFALTQMLGLPYDDAAAILGCSPGTLRSRVARARAELVRRLDPTITDEPSVTGDPATPVNTSPDDRP